MDKLDLSKEVSEENMSLVESILRKTKDPKIAAVLALDLLLVGVDTVSCKSFDRLNIFFRVNNNELFMAKDLCSSLIYNVSTQSAYR